MWRGEKSFSAPRRRVKRRRDLFFHPPKHLSAKNEITFHMISPCTLIFQTQLSLNQENFCAFFNSEIFLYIVKQSIYADVQLLLYTKTLICLSLVTHVYCDMYTFFKVVFKGTISIILVILRAKMAMHNFFIASLIEEMRKSLFQRNNK